MTVNNTAIDYWRQLDVFSPDAFKKAVTIIGVGATGSYVTKFLTKIGCRDITVYDDDVVENYNLPNQTYELQDIGKKKVDALRRLAHEGSGIDLTAIPEKFFVGTLTGIVFVLTDTMESRKKIWESSLRYQPNVDLVIETRMEAQGGRIYAVRPFLPKDVDGYEKTLYSDAESAESPCTRRAIAPTAGVLAGLSVSFMIDFCNGNRVPNETIFSLSPLLFLTREF